MTVFEDIKLSNDEIKCKAFMNDSGPGDRLVVKREMSVSDTYNDAMIIHKDLWYLNQAACRGLLFDGCTCTINEGAPDRYDESYVTVTGHNKNKTAALNAAKLMGGD